MGKIKLIITEKMKFDSLFKFSFNPFIKTVLILLICLMCIEAITSIKSNSQIVDEKFLKVYNNLKHSMTRKGSKISDNLGVKFITKDNRFIMGTKNIKNNTDLIRIPFKTLINIKNPKIRNFCQNLGLTEFKNEEALLKDWKDYSCLQLWVLNETKHPSKEFKEYIDTVPKSWDEYYYFWPKKDQEKVIFIPGFRDCVNIFFKFFTWMF